MAIYNWLDLTARGRQEDWEQPPVRSDRPLMGWLAITTYTAHSHFWMLPPGWSHPLTSA